jgi:uncharacterized protein (DUF952 family)
MSLLTHLLPRSHWEAALEQGEYRPASLAQEGFIHCSCPEQVQQVGRRYYREAPDLLLLWVDPQRVEAEIRWEASHGEVFPHIYGPLNLAAVLAVQAFDVESEELRPPDLTP